jgi:hypothetical protein
VPVANLKAYRRRSREGNRNLNRDLRERVVPQDYEDRIGNRICALLREHDDSCAISIPSRRIASLSSSRGRPTIKVIGGRSLACGSEPQHVPAELRDARNTHQLHVALDLRPHVAERLLNARLSGCGERVKIHSPA